MASNPIEPRSGEVLPPLDSRAEFPIGPPLRGVPLFSRMRYVAAQKELLAFRDAIIAAGEVVAARTTLSTNMVEHERAATRLGRLDEIRAIAELEVTAELLEATKRVHRLVEDKELDELRRRQERANLEADALEAELRVAALKNPSPAKEVPKPRTLAEEITRLREEEKRLKESLIEAVGGVEQLSEEDRDLLGQIALMTRERIARLVERMGDER